MASLLTWYTGQNKLTKALLATLSAVLPFCLCFVIVTWSMGSKGDELMGPYYQADSLIRNKISSIKKPADLPQEYFDTFKTQYEILDARKKHHLALAFVFFKNYYGVTVVLMALSCAGGIVLFFILNKGWAASPFTLKIIFLSFVLVGTFFGFFPAVFKQQENFNENMKVYLEYTKAEVGILRDLSTIQEPSFYKDENLANAVSFKRVDSLVNNNYKTINSLTTYVLGMDPSKIKSIGDVSKSLGEIGK